MSERRPVYSLSISGRMTLEMHSLNNEGGEGNQTMTRTVTLVDAQGDIHKVNAISGDMFKHIQAEHFYRLARERGLPLCAGCQTFRADRILGDTEFMRDLPDRDEETINALLSRCALDDAEGTLIARGARSVPRKSVAEFSWVVGLPDRVRTESYFHVRYAAELLPKSGPSSPSSIAPPPPASTLPSLPSNWPASASTTSARNIPLPRRSGCAGIEPSWKACFIPSWSRTGPCGAPRIPTSSPSRG